jgi:hypothetical protein
MFDFTSLYTIKYNNYLRFPAPKYVILELTDDLDCFGEYIENASHIKIKRRSLKNMRNTIQHELVHLFLVEVLGINPENDHPLEFWEFWRRFKRFHNKNVREYGNEKHEILK